MVQPCNHAVQSTPQSARSATGSGPPSARWDMDVDGQPDVRQEDGKSAIVAIGTPRDLTLANRIRRTLRKTIASSRVQEERTQGIANSLEEQLHQSHMANEYNVQEMSRAKQAIHNYRMPVTPTVPQLQLSNLFADECSAADRQSFNTKFRSIGNHLVKRVAFGFV
eukprot:623580-Amphidinium_carterae.1